MKPWYKRRRYWAVALLVVLAYFCLIPMPLQISPATTGITEPRLPNGDVDYFGYYERLYIHKLSPPENNGQRLLIAALGPRTLEQSYIADTVPWEEMPTHERSKEWFETYWIPLCEHMYIDPYDKPMFLDNLEFFGFLRKEWETSKTDGDSYYDDQPAHELWKQLVAAPWTVEEHPNIARWLEERSPVLDLFGVAVRKPNFVCWRQRPEAWGVLGILLPDVQGNRTFARELQIRITERLGKSDVDGAWHDVMSMLILSRHHYIHEPMSTVNLVGMAIEGMGMESAKAVLQYGNPTSEQLERFAQDLKTLPRKMTLDSTLVEKASYEELKGFAETLERGALKIDLESQKVLAFLVRLINPFRWIGYNIAGKRLTERFDAVKRTSGGSINRTVMKKYFDFENIPFEHWCYNCYARSLLPQTLWDLLRVPLIRTRSQLVADRLFDGYDYGIRTQNALDRNNTQFDLLLLAVALERYKVAKGNYPATLDELVPAFLEDVPIDLYTGRKTLTYKLAPDEETACLLYSFGENETDDGGNEKEDIVLRMRKPEI